MHHLKLTSTASTPEKNLSAVKAMEKNNNNPLVENKFQEK